MEASAPVQAGARRFPAETNRGPSGQQRWRRTAGESV